MNTIALFYLHESLFAIIQKKFFEEQERLFGTDHIYGVDSFNEMGLLSWEPDYLKKVSSNLYHTLVNADSKAEGLQMTWMFYVDKKKWTTQRVEAFLKGRYFILVSESSSLIFSKDGYTTKEVEIEGVGRFECTDT